MKEFQYHVTDMEGNILRISTAAVETEQDAKNLVNFWNRRAACMKTTYCYQYVTMLKPLTNVQLERGTPTYDGNVKRHILYK